MSGFHPFPESDVILEEEDRIPNFQKVDSCNRYLLAAAAYCGIEFTITEGGRCFGPEHSNKELLETKTSEEISEDYIRHDGSYYKDLDNLVNNTMMGRFVHEDSDEEERINQLAGFKWADEVSFFARVHNRCRQ